VILEQIAGIYCAVNLNSNCIIQIGQWAHTCSVERTQ